MGLSPYEYKKLQQGKRRPKYTSGVDLKRSSEWLNDEIDVLVVKECTEREEIQDGFNDILDCGGLPSINLKKEELVEKWSVPRKNFRVVLLMQRDKKEQEYVCYQERTFDNFEDFDELIDSHLKVCSFDDPWGRVSIEDSKVHSIDHIRLGNGDESIENILNMTVLIFLSRLYLKKGSIERYAPTVYNSYREKLYI